MQSFIFLPIAILQDDILHSSTLARTSQCCSNLVGLPFTSLCPSPPFPKSTSTRCRRVLPSPYGGRLRLSPVFFLTRVASQKCRHPCEGRVRFVCLSEMQPSSALTGVLCREW